MLTVTVAKMMPHSGVQVRFEFVFHRSLKPWLVEVNASPNIRPTPTELHHDGMPFRGLCNSMATWTVSATQGVRQRNHQQVLGLNTEHVAEETHLLRRPSSARVHVAW